MLVVGSGRAGLRYPATSVEGGIWAANVTIGAPQLHTPLYGE